LGNLALHSACFSGADVQVIQALVQTAQKAVGARNHQGSLPIDICQRLRHDNRSEVMSVLKRSGTWSELAKEAEGWNQKYVVVCSAEERVACVCVCSVSRDCVFVCYYFRLGAPGCIDEPGLEVEVAYEDEQDNQELLWI
jgi:hypothetical protein